MSQIDLILPHGAFLPFSLTRPTVRARLRVTGRDGQEFFKNISLSMIHHPVMDCPPVQMVHAGPGVRQNVTCFVWCHPPMGGENVTWRLLQTDGVRGFQVSFKTFYVKLDAFCALDNMFSDSLHVCITIAKGVFHRRQNGEGKRAELVSDSSEL